MFIQPPCSQFVDLFSLCFYFFGHNLLFSLHILQGDITDLAVSSNNVLVASASNDFIIRVVRIPYMKPSMFCFLFLNYTDSYYVQYSGACQMGYQSLFCGGILELSLLLHLAPGPALYISFYRESHSQSCCSPIIATLQYFIGLF